MKPMGIAGVAGSLVGVSLEAKGRSPSVAPPPWYLFVGSGLWLRVVSGCCFTTSLRAEETSP